MQNMLWPQAEPNRGTPALAAFNRWAEARKRRAPRRTRLCTAVIVPLLELAANSYLHTTDLVQDVCTTAERR